MLADTSGERDSHQPLTGRRIGIRHPSVEVDLQLLHAMLQSAEENVSLKDPRDAESDGHGSELASTRWMSPAKPGDAS